MNYLKPLRLIVALVFIILTSILFFNFPDILKSNFDNIVLGFQFIPSMLNFFKTLSIFAIGFILFTLLALLFGRVYCSFICPLGIIQDALIRISRKFKKKKRNPYKFKPPVPWVRHVLLFLTVLALLMGSTSLILILDPYSNYGRMATHIFQPIYLFVNNVVAHFANMAGWYGVYHIEFHAFNWAAFFFALTVLGVLLVMTLTRGRLFCNTICPVGTFLGWVSKLSVFKLKFLNHKCISCGLCEKNCKSECIDFKAMSIDFDRCVACYNCVNVCPEEAISYLPANKVNGKNTVTDDNKRNTLKTLAVAAAGVSGLSFTVDEKSLSSFRSTVPVKSKFPVTPPGSLSIEHFKSKCTACHLCVSACPTNVIQSTFIDYGIDGLFMPKLNYQVNYCQYECTLCGEVCPTGAILPMMLENKKLVQMGKVKFVSDNCVVTQNEDDCGACAEHCPTKAVRMVPYKDHHDLFIPEVDTDLCIGCGACEHPCPVRPYKAIYVESNPVHEIAKKPEKKSTEQKEDVDEEFPF